jgi:hypothetical protein
MAPKEKYKANKNIKVSQKTIDQIKKQGMSASLKASNSTPEYREALKRMYGEKRVAKTQGSPSRSANRSVPAGGVQASSKYKNVMGGGSTTAPVKKTAVKRNAAGKVVKAQSWADLTPAQKKAAEAKIKTERNKTSRTIGKVVGAVSAPFGPLGAAAAIYGTRDIRKKKSK